MVGLLRLFDSQFDVIAIQERFSARIGRERDQRFLRIVDGGTLRIIGRSIKNAGSARTAHARASAGRVGHQAARIDRVDRHVGFCRGIDRRFKLGLIIDSGFADRRR